MSFESHSLEPSRAIASISRYALVTAAYNTPLVEALYARAEATLLEYGVLPENIERHPVPGSSEIPYVLNMLALTGEYDCLLALGVVIAGDTDHHAIIGQSTAVAIQQVGIQTEIPIVNGIIVANTPEQAEVRTRGEQARGREFALTALCMAAHKIECMERLDALDMEANKRRSTLENN